MYFTHKTNEACLIDSYCQVKGCRLQYILVIKRLNVNQITNIGQVTYLLNYNQTRMTTFIKKTKFKISDDQTIIVK